MAKPNIGKIFEQSIKSSFPDYVYVTRLPDPPQSFTQRSDTRFSHKNPFDYLVFDTVARKLYCLELKTTKYKSISFEDISEDNPTNKMIHKHQILGLSKAAENKNVVAGFVLNFRDEKNNIERTYFIEINDFNKMCRRINKSSCNEMDIILNGAIKIKGTKKRTRFSWDMDEFFSNYDKER